MLFQGALRKELGRSFAATLVVVLTVVLTMMLIRTLGQAAGGTASPQDVVLLLGFATMAHLPTMITLSLFVAVVLTLGRMYRDSEMAVWFSSGLSLARMVRPVLWTAAPGLALVAVMITLAWPWVNRQTLEVRERYNQRSDVARVAPGLFQTSSDGQRVFFIDRDSAESRQASNVFILAQDRGKESVTTALSGTVLNQGQDRFAVLDRGQRNEFNTATGERALASFESYRVLIDQAQSVASPVLPPKALSTLDLLDKRSAMNDGELCWRLGLLLGACNLTLLGIGLSPVNPRRSGNWNLVLALLSFIVYFNLINLTQSSVAGRRLSLEAALCGLHGLAFLCAQALIWWRDHATSWSWPRLRPADQAIQGRT
ncbi:MAG: LPS export ABC transporter permease LptF [Betaproteobacteria bacterium]